MERDVANLYKSVQDMCDKVETVGLAEEVAALSAQNHRLELQVDRLTRVVSGKHR
jgi:hypothetical protein